MFKLTLVFVSLSVSVFAGTPDYFPATVTDEYSFGPRPMKAGDTFEFKLTFTGSKAHVIVMATGMVPEDQLILRDDHDNKFVVTGMNDGWGRIFETIDPANAYITVIASENNPNMMVSVGLTNTNPNTNGNNNNNNNNNNGNNGNNNGNDKDKASASVGIMSTSFFLVSRLFM